MHSIGFRGSVLDRFWGKVDIRSSNECWPWTASTDTHGYEQFAINPPSFDGQRLVRAHNFAWVLSHKADLDEKETVNHHCDNRPCCNPAHVYRGTRADNNQDTRRRGNWSNGERPSGEQHPMAKLTDVQVAQIRNLVANGKTQYEVAELFDVSQGHISRLVRGANR